MKVRIEGRVVEVVDEDCPFRSCYHLGFDKGSFTPGVGYTRYHSDGDRPVCWTRHMSGCPHREPEDGVEKLYDDGCILVALRDPEPCCDNPDVPDRRAYTQTCRSCGARLRGRRLEIARGDPDGLLRVVRDGDRWKAPS